MTGQNRMRWMIAMVAVCAATVQAQEPQRSAVCAPASHGAATYSYYRAVLDNVRPPGWPNSQITISVSVTGVESRLVLTTDGTTFDLLQGTPEKNIHAFLGELDRSCRLPVKPTDAGKLVKVDWERAEMTPREFEQLHRSFMDALTRYVSSAEGRYQSVVTNGGVVHLHAPEYVVSYDNHGFEHLEVSVSDYTDDPDKMDPVVKWVRGIFALRDQLFRKK